MSYGKERRPGDRGSDGHTSVPHRRVAPGRRPLTSRLSAPVQARTSNPQPSERQRAASTQKESAQVGPSYRGHGSPIPPVDMLLGGTGERAAGEPESSAPLPCEAALLAALPESPADLQKVNDETAALKVLETVSALEARVLSRRLEDPAEPLGRRFASLPTSAKHKVRAILHWRK